MLLFGCVLVALLGICNHVDAVAHVNSTTACQIACHEISLLFPEATWSGDAARKHMWSLFQANARPLCRVKPRATRDVAAVLEILVANSCPFAVLGGGTSPFAGASNIDGGVTIDLGSLNSIRIPEDNPAVVEVGGGVVWAELYRFLDPLNLSSAGTRNSLTGVVGSILGGGISFFSQRHGWSCDNVVSFEVVLANSSVVQASQHHNAELFWALRGGGNNFGIVTSLTLDTFPQAPSWYTFQRWPMRALESIFYRLEQLTIDMPPLIQMVATTLGWSPHLQEFTISERLVATSPPELPRTQPIRNAGANSAHTAALEEYVYVKTTLEMAQKMDRMNAEGFFNYFGSVTVRSQAEINMEIANIFFDEVEHIKSARGVQVYIVYNPVTVPAMEQMRKRGGNVLGLNPQGGPLTIVNINLHWATEPDTPRMRTFMRRMIARIEDRARRDGVHHPYVFLNHCFEEQLPLASYGEGNVARLHALASLVDPGGVFQVLQPGHHKLQPTHPRLGMR